MSIFHQPLHVWLFLLAAILIFLLASHARGWTVAKRPPRDSAGLVQWACAIVLLIWLLSALFAE